jgi:Flp pilus assembly protein TadD
MVKYWAIPAILAGAVVLTGCQNATSKETAEKKVIGVIDETDLNDIMLTVADPNEAVNYFQNALTKDPKRVEFKRGLAQSLMRAKRIPEAVSVYEELVEAKSSTNQDRINYAEVLIRDNKWKPAKTQLDMVPPTIETFQRYRLEAMIADSNKDWKKADSFYETAAGMTTQPASVYNNWGFSKLTRGNVKEAERLFVKSITYDKSLFTAKNNLILARGTQRNYQMPVIPVTDEERAVLLYTLGLSAVKQNDQDVAVGLFQEAIDVHPRHFPEAQRALTSLEGKVIQ